MKAHFMTQPFQSGSFVKLLSEAPEMKTCNDLDSYAMFVMLE